MNERAKAYWDRLLNWWKNQAPAQKLRVGGFVVLGLAVLVTGWTLVTSPDWQPLYTNLDPRTAGQITNQLSQMKIPYELTNGGATILVPKKTSTRCGWIWPIRISHPAARWACRSR